MGFMHLKVKIEEEFNLKTKLTETKNLKINSIQQCGGSLCRNAKHPCDMSVKSNFTFDLIFLIDRIQKKKWFPFFLCPKSKMAAWSK